MKYVIIIKRVGDANENMSKLWSYAKRKRYNLL